MLIEGQTVSAGVGSSSRAVLVKGASQMTGRNRIPLVVKIAYTLFVAVLIPNYWRAYSPWTFLYFCDVALLLTLPALWLESPLLISLPAVGLTLPQLLWVVDFLTGAPHGFGDDELYVRSQHTPARAWAVHISRLAAVSHGLGRVAFRVRSTGATRLDGDQHGDPAHELFSRPGPSRTIDSPNLAVNINYVHGMNYKEPQSIMPPSLWLASMIMGFPLVFYLPTHLIFRAFFPPATPPKAQLGTETGTRQRQDVISRE